MTREELKEHCEKQIEMCEMWAIGKGEKPSGNIYEEHKLILELLEQEPCEDAVNRQAVLNTLDNMDKALDVDRSVENYKELLKECYEVLPSVTPQPTKWIPIKFREATEEEKERCLELYGYEIEKTYDCQLPEHGEDVLITTCYGDVKIDTFYNDDGCYFENYCDDDEVVAWQPLPKPYKGE